MVEVKIYKDEELRQEKDGKLAIYFVFNDSQEEEKLNVASGLFGEGISISDAAVATAYNLAEIIIKACRENGEDASEAAKILAGTARMLQIHGAVYMADAYEEDNNGSNED